MTVPWPCSTTPGSVIVYVTESPCSTPFITSLPTSQALSIPEKAPVTGSYDVIVVGLGKGPAGVACLTGRPQSVMYA